MNNKVRILIVFVIVTVVGVIIAGKRKDGTIEEKTPVVASTGVGNMEQNASNTDVNTFVPVGSQLDLERDGVINREVSKKLPKFIDIGASKCIPCKMMAPILEQLKIEYSDSIEVIFIDVNEKRDEASKYSIRMIPTQILFDASGKELFRHEGFISKADILAKWKEIGLEFKKSE